MRILSKEYIESLLSYNREDGTFVWLVSRGSVRAGRLAGTLNPGRDKPYYMIKIDRKFYYAHKLAWLLEYGEWPESIDHINNDGLDNRIKNLRRCDMTHNKANSKTYRNNKLGVKGVVRDGERYLATIQKHGKKMRLGVFDTIEEAAQAYKAAAQFHFGEFARVA